MSRNNVLGEFAVKKSPDQPSTDDRIVDAAGVTLIWLNPYIPVEMVVLEVVPPPIKKVLVPGSARNVIPFSPANLTVGSNWFPEKARTVLPPLTSNWLKAFANKVVWFEPVGPFTIPIFSPASNRNLL
jgi:hypothetical protein